MWVLQDLYKVRIEGPGINAIKLQVTGFASVLEQVRVLIIAVGTWRAMSCL